MYNSITYFRVPITDLSLIRKRRWRSIPMLLLRRSQGKEASIQVFTYETAQNVASRCIQNWTIPTAIRVFQYCLIDSNPFHFSFTFPSFLHHFPSNKFTIWNSVYSMFTLWRNVFSSHLLIVSLSTRVL